MTRKLYRDYEAECKRDMCIARCLFTFGIIAVSLVMYLQVIKFQHEENLADIQAKYSNCAG